MGIPVIVMEPLRGGSLVKELPKKAVEAFRAADPERSLAEWGLRWVWNHTGVKCVLSGMSAESEADENIRLAGLCEPNSLSEAELNAYQSVINILGETLKVPCTACGYCMPCPKGVDIPTCFASYNMVYSSGRGGAIRRYMQNIDALNTDAHYAGKCVNCGKCETHCPQSIQIRKELANAAKTLEPWWFNFGMKTARMFMGRGRNK